MKIKQYYLVLILIIINYVSVYAQVDKLSKTAIQEDLNYLKTALEKHHANLYVYSNPKEIENWFKSQQIRLPDSLTSLDVFKLVTSFSNILKDGHSYIYPSAKYLEDFFNSAPLFPLDVFLKNDELIVIEDCSDEQTIPIGSKLASINGVSIKEIQSTITPNLAHDGDNMAYPKYLFYQFFPAYYSAYYGFQTAFSIEFYNKKGVLTTVDLKGLTRDKRRANNAKEGVEKIKGIALDIDEQRKLATLKILSFDNKNLKNDYQQKFKKEITQAFKTLAETDISSLVIDLRDNEGGELSNGAHLLKYFMKDEFQLVNSYFTIREGENGERVEKQLSNKWDNYMKPKKSNHFIGSVYIFTNGGSFSCSAIVANTFKENGRGIILGSMTGGSAFINAGAPNKVITLPNSKILFTIPKTKYQLREDLTTIELGVVPHITIEDALIDPTNGKDDYMEALYKLMISY